MISTRVAVIAVSTLMAVALVPVLGPAAAATPAATTSTADSKVFTDNIASGSKCNPKHAGPYNCLTVVDQQIKSWKPDAVSVDEACAYDVANFRKAHPHWDIEFKADAPSTPNKCGTKVAHGNFVAAPKLSRFVAYKLDNVHQGSRTMYLLCARAASLWICTVHLPYQDHASLQAMPNVHKDEIKQIVRRVKSLHGRVAVCGDFNMRSGNPAFDRFRKNNFTEASPDNSGRTGYDHIWWYRADGKKVAGARAHVVPQPTRHFDHDMLQGRVRW